MRGQAGGIRLEVEAHAAPRSADERDAGRAGLADERHIHQTAGVMDQERVEDVILADDGVLAGREPVVDQVRAVGPLAHGRRGAEIDRAAVLQHGLKAAVAGGGDAIDGGANQEVDLAARGEVALDAHTAVAEAGAGADVHLDVLGAGLGRMRIEEHGATDGGEDEQGHSHPKPAPAPERQAGATSSRGRRATVGGSAGGGRIHVVQNSKLRRAEVHNSHHRPPSSAYVKESPLARRVA